MKKIGENIGEKIGEKNWWKKSVKKIGEKNRWKKSVKKIGEKIGEKNQWKKSVKKIGEISVKKSIGQLLSWTHQMSAGRAWKWKWSYGVEKSETDLFWYISMTNNVKSCKKINGRVQTFIFSVFTMGLCWKRQKTQKLEKLKCKLLKILNRYDLSRVAPCESWRPEVSENVVVFEDWSF